MVPCWSSGIIGIDEPSLDDRGLETSSRLTRRSSSGAGRGCRRSRLRHSVEHDWNRSRFANFVKSAAALYHGQRRGRPDVSEPEHLGVVAGDGTSP